MDRSVSLRLRPANMPMIWCGHTVTRLDSLAGPIDVDRLINASFMMLLDSARRNVAVPALARWPLAWASRRRSRPT